MSTDVPPTHNRTVKQTTHSKDDALTDREFQLLLEGAGAMRDYYGQQARFITLVAGRLGLRSGEIAHMREDWIDWRRNMIVVPRHQACEKGEDGGICGYCRAQAKQRVEHNEEMTLDEALRYSWSAKTDAAAREVPFDFDPRTELAIERFFDRYEEYPCSRQSINRRIKRAAEEAPELDPDDIYPHCLRATAATAMAARGLDILPMQSMFGWSDISTAQAYIAQSGENTARALHSIHSR